MNINNYLLPLSCLALLGQTSANAASKNSKPNVIIILADDYGWNDLGCMGSKYYETPNLDRLAKRSVMFTNGYANCSVSSPSRASIMTGQYTTRHGITDWIGEASGEAWAKKGRNTKLLPSEYVHNLPKSETTIAEALKQYGYRTFMAGKWHLGSEGSWPEDHGFDINKGGWTAGSPMGGYFSPYKNPKLTNGPKGENLSMRLAKETVKFIKENENVKRSEAKPFFAYLAFYAVHGAIQTSMKNWSYFRDKAEKMGIANHGFKFDRTMPVRIVQDNPVYAGLIKQMDDAIGVVLDAIDEMGLDKNTMIIFTGDNGGVVSGDAFSTCLAPLRGGKGRQWEGGIREPFFIYCPESKLAGTKCDVPVIGMDFYPTILDYLKIPLVPHQHIDGVSLMPLLKGENIPERSLFWHYPHYGNQGGEPSSIIRRGDWKLIYYYEDKHYELYNLKNDIGETTPVNTLYPEKLEELKTLLQAWLIETHAKIPQANPNYNPAAKMKELLKWQTTGLQKKETQRKNMLKKDWKPNKDWWGSQVTND